MITTFSARAQTSALKELDEIDKGLFQNPVKAKQELLVFIKSYPNVADTIKGLAYSSLSLTMGMTNQLDSGIWAANESVRLLPDNSIVKAGSLKTLAILYRLKGDWKKAEQSIQLSMALNDSLWKDSYLKVVTLQEYASLCLDQNNYYKATNLYIDALKIYQSKIFNHKSKELTLAKLRINLAEAYLRSENYPFAIREFKSAFPVLDSLKDYDGLVRSGLNLSDAYIKSGQLKQADSLLNVLAPINKRLQNEELEAYLFFKSGDLKSAELKFSSAIPYYQEAFKLLDKNNSPIILECANAYLNALEKTDNHAEALAIIKNPNVKNALNGALISDRLKFKRAALPFIWNSFNINELYQYTLDLTMLSDSAAIDHENKSAAQIQAQYQVERQQEIEELLVRENEVLKEKDLFKKKQLYFIVSIAVLALALLGLLIFRLRQRSKAKDMALKSKEQELQFQKERSLWVEKEKDLRDQLIQQQKDELMRSIEDAEELRVKFEQLVAEQQEGRRKELLDEFEKNKTEKRGIEYLLAQFNAMHPNFISALNKNYPQLSQSDIQFCTMCRMNLSTKEISSLFNIENRSVYARKYRIMKKMGLNENDDFEQLLFQIV
jgi:tetratricopeptide (TPR) repeat protein/DNA-binding CsgD family transcriptional regulator